MSYYWFNKQEILHKKQKKDILKKNQQTIMHKTKKQ